MKLRPIRRVSSCLAAAVLVIAIAAAAAITAQPSAATTASSVTTASTVPWDAGQPSWWTPTAIPSGPSVESWGPGADGGSSPAESNSSHIEYFHVVSTRPSGPGTIIITGAINAGGTERPGRAIDGANFTEGTFRIDHSAGQPTSHFNPSTCVGTITQFGPFKVIDTTRGLRGLAGSSGHYSFRALYTTAREAGRCTSTMTAYTETINGVATVK
jgi:hypothetical protein